jgi:hypothetical protein
MSNILFSKKFLTKLTAIIRNFWWTGVQEDQTIKSLCLRAWADICTDKKAGGLGIRNLQAINQGLILSAAWRLAKEPQSQLAQILKAKYHHDTSIWRAKSNGSKSAFWTAVLKVRPLLVSAITYQIVDGNSSVWSTPWFKGWEGIYDNLIIQQQPFSYPAQVKDLWITGQKCWNVNLINSLFSPVVSMSILQTPIIETAGQDILVWKLTPTGQFSPKSAYKHCFNNLQLPPSQRPKIVPPHVIALLDQVWKEKQMAPRIQTFAWRLLRNALSTGKRAGKYSKHISENCPYCGKLEDEMHLFFLCPFAKAAWYSHPWYIKTEFLAQHHYSIPQMIQALLTSHHPQISISSLYTFLWCIWKARNDARFCRILSTPSQVHAAAMAIMQGSNMESKVSSQIGDTARSSNSRVLQHASMQGQQRQGHADQQIAPSLGRTINNISTISCPIIFSDAAWSPHPDGSPVAAGLGIYIKLGGDRSCSELSISAISPPTTSAIQAEAFSLMLASRIAETLHIQQATFLTDCATLATAASSQNMLRVPGHWSIRPQLAQIASSTAFDSSMIYHINRGYNFRAHHQAKLALKIQNTSFSYRCLDSGTDTCLNADIAAVSCIMQCKIVHVRCC